MQILELFLLQIIKVQSILNYIITNVNIIL